MPELLAQNLVKRYKARTVVDDVSISVNSGEVVGLLGPNGAGKTTSFYMMVGLIRADEGSIFLDGRNRQHGRDAVEAAHSTSIPAASRMRRAGCN